MLLPFQVFDGLDPLGRCAAEPVLQVVRGALTIVEFVFDYYLLNHLNPYLRNARLRFMRAPANAGSISMALR